MITIFSHNDNKTGFGGKHYIWRIQTKESYLHPFNKHAQVLSASTASADGTMRKAQAKTPTSFSKSGVVSSLSSFFDGNATMSNIP